MSEDRKKTNPLALRTAYEVEGLRVGEIAKKFGVSPAYISKLKKLGKWIEPTAQPSSAVHDAVNTEVNELTRQAMKNRQAELDKAVQAATDAALASAGAVTEHAAAADEALAVGRVLLSAIKNGIGGPVSLRSMAETFKLIVEATDKAARLARDVRGVRVGEPSAPPDAADKDFEFSHTVYEAPKSDVAV